ncbi:MAG: histidine kinase [Actinomycetota bacterium]
MTDLIVDGKKQQTPSTTAPSDAWGAAVPPEEEVPDTGADRLGHFQPAILAVRWATTAVSMVLASPDIADGRIGISFWVVATLATTVIRTFRPFRDDGSIRSMIVLLAEIALHVLAVIATGYWASPLVLMLINAIIVAGFARGFAFALRVGAASTLAVSVPEIGQPNYGNDELARSAQWATLLLLGGIVAGYARRISGEVSRRHHQALDRVARLADANALLSKLHAMTQTLPASLDQGEVLDSTMSRLRGLVAHDTALVLTTESAEGFFTVSRSQGIDLSGDREIHELPRPAQRAIGSGRPVTVPRITGDGVSFDPRAVCGMYIPLTSRDRLVGLLAIERRREPAFSDRDRRMLQGFVEPVALSIDNARWFKRLRTVGADEERTRIARDLHDRIGQSLAHLGFEIDRLIRRHAGVEPTATELRELRQSLREVVVEVRDALSDLRTDVSDMRDFVATATDFADRLSERSGLRIIVECEAEQRLPLRQEREMWRIAQEALVNVERHADASLAELRWQCNGAGALLEVCDDGRGLPDRGAHGGYGRPDSFGIVGMRERADSIGAELELISEPGEGTKVRCFLAKR